MQDKSFRFDSRNDGFSLQAYVWETADPKAVVVIAHGAAEHALRYERFARALNEAGIDAWALDHRGHGQSPGPEGLGDFGKGGWDALVDDVGQLIGMAREAYPDLPVILFGHSMGSAAAQQYIRDRSSTIDALILSGSSARKKPSEGEEPLMRPDPNRGFEGRTNYDWLSRDEAEVDKYIADPFCGFESMASKRFGESILKMRRYHDSETFKTVRHDLPCLLVAGDRDPINNNLKGLDYLEELWREAGIKRIDKQYYKDGRHEMLNEINREEVTQNIINWINEVFELR
jgi:alpha-beta hydrolase superfamily lysophospholipase